MWSVTYEEDLLKSNYEFVLDENIFFPAAHTVQLDQFKTDILYYGGMDPWTSCESSLYEMALAGDNILKLGLALILALF